MGRWIWEEEEVRGGRGQNEGEEGKMREGGGVRRRGGLT